MARRFVYLIATLLLTGFGVLAGAPAAWAHATLVTTDPADGAIVKQAPTSVSATFDQSVGVSSTSLEVFAPNGSRVDTGGTIHGSKPQEITVKLKTGLGHGTYTVGWHVISADSHPVQGAWTFSVGAPSTTSVNPSTLNLTANPLIGVAFGTVRWVAFCCFALLIGAVCFVLWCWPAGASSALVLRLTMGAWSGLAASVLGALLLQGVYGGGQGVGKVFWPNVLHSTLYSRYGRSLGIRLILVIVALFVFTWILGSLRAEDRDRDRRASVTASVVWGVLAAALAATWAAADHAGTGIQVPLALPSDIVHLSAVALWLGGLVMLAAIVLRRPNGGSASGSKSTKGRPANRKRRVASADTIQAVERFSPIALGCVVAIVITGTYQAWRGVGTWPALIDTTYGRLLLIKIAAMGALIVLGYLARIRIAALRTPATAPLSLAEFVAAGLPRVAIGAGRSGLAEGPANGTHGNGANGNGANGNGAHGNDNGTHSNGKHNNGKHNNGKHNGANGNGAHPAGGDGSPSDSDRSFVTLARLRWSVGAEASIAAAVLAVTSILVNTATARESFTQPVHATVAFNTGGPGGRGELSVTVTPAVLGPNQVRVTVIGTNGKPYQPKQLQAALVLPARHLGPLPVALKADGPGRYASASITMTITGQWQLQFTVRSDAFDETTVSVPVAVQPRSG
ncbi:MAG TPA: copper resistance protein CopC [Streptosporangiaceae bacterium]|nr:copper resistance protein CopC [Streptosporangiaceae bacterium]